MKILKLLTLLSSCCLSLLSLEYSCRPSKPFQLHCNIKVQTVTITLPWQNVSCPSSEINMLAQCVALGQHAVVMPRGG